MKKSFKSCDLWDGILGSSVNLTENKILGILEASTF